jgi:cytochrome c oxidase subunit IV
MEISQTGSVHVSPRYMAIFWLLLGMTIGEVLIATYVPMSMVVKILVLVGMAGIKALLVALYFMHLKFERVSLGITVSLTLVLALILIVAILGQWIFHSPSVEMPPRHAAPSAQK